MITALVPLNSLHTRVIENSDGTPMRNGSYYFSLPGFVCADFYDAVQTVVYTNSQCKNITYVRQSQLLKI
jgi:hypothetical protein